MKKVLIKLSLHKMVEKAETGAGKMKRGWKSQVAKLTGGNQKFDRKAMKIKSSWDEVEKLLNSSVKKKK